GVSPILAGPDSIRSVVFVFPVIPVFGVIVVVVLHLRRDGAKQPVFETVDPRREEQSVRGTVRGSAAAESDCPKPIDGQRAAAPMQKADKLTSGRIECCDASAAKIADQQSIAKFPKVGWRHCDTPWRVEGGFAGLRRISRFPPVSKMSTAPNPR